MKDLFKKLDYFFFVGDMDGRIRNMISFKVYKTH